jgi:HlyD family secretion protein
MKTLAIIAIVFALLVSGCSAMPQRNQAAAPTLPPVAAPTTRAMPQGAITAEGHVVPVRHAALGLPGGGIAAELLVAEGESVQSGQVLLRLDQGRAAAAVAGAEAELARAQASLALLRQGPTEQDIMVAEAAVQKARAQLQQTQGAVTSSDVRAAQARLQEARARLAEVEQNGRANQVAGAEARVQQQQAALESERARLSAAKTEAKLKMDQSVTELTKAQSAFVIAKTEWDSVNETGKHPSLNYGLSDAERRQFYDTFVQAEATLKSAEAAVQAARVAYDAAREAEATGVQSAEQTVAQSEAALRAERADTNNDELAAARAAVADAQAELNRLQGDERSGTVAVSEASVAEADAELARLRAGPTTAQLAVAEADVQRAQAALKAVQVAATETELRAPFAGTVGVLDLQVGEYVAPGTPVVQLADLSDWQIETTDLTETDIEGVHEGSQVTVTFDAIPEIELPGSVARIRQVGENKQGDITYTVIVKLNQHDPRLRWNMTASVAISQ